MNSSIRQSELIDTFMRMYTTHVTQSEQYTRQYSHQRVHNVDVLSYIPSFCSNAGCNFLMQTIVELPNEVLLYSLPRNLNVMAQFDQISFRSCRPCQDVSSGPRLAQWGTDLVIIMGSAVNLHLESMLGCMGCVWLCIVLLKKNTSLCWCMKGDRTG